MAQRAAPARASLGLGSRLIFGIVILVGILCVLLSIVSRNAILDVVAPHEHDREAKRIARLSAGLREDLSNATADLRAALQAIPLAQALDDSVETSQRAATSSRVAALFRAVAGAHPNYLQFRLIGSAHDGREVVRVHRRRSGEEVVEVSPDDLQSKGDRSYFKKTIALAAGEIWVSPLELNYEYGAVERPAVPVVRLASPVYCDDSRACGVVVINLDMRTALEGFRESNRGVSENYLMDAEGNFLVHPDARFEFAAELGQSDLGSVPHYVERLGIDALARSTTSFIERAPRDYVIVASDTLNFGAQKLIAFSITSSNSTQAISHTITELWALTLLIGLAVVIVATVVVESIVRPIEAITRAAHLLNDGAQVELPIDAAGEVGVLARAFDAMQTGLKMRALALERKSALLEQSIARARLHQAVVESSGDAVLTFDREERVTSCNRAAERLYGVEAAKIIGKPVRSLAVGQILPSDALDLGTKFGKIHQCKCDFVGGDGTSHRLSLSLSPIYSAHGKPAGHASVVRDTSEQDRAEACSRMAVEASPAGMLMIDVRGTISLVNPELERIFGYTREELVGHSVELLLPEEVRERHQSLRAAFLAHAGSGPSTLSLRDLEGLHRDGAKIPLELVVNVVSTPTELLAMAVVVDLTQSRRREAELRAQQEFERLLELLPDAVVATNNDNELLYINGAGKKFFNGNLGPTRRLFANLGAPSERGEWRVTTEHEKKIGEAHVVRGQWRGQNARLAIIRDVSAQKWMERQLMLSGRLAALGTIAAGVAHEINTPIQFVSDSLHFIEESTLGLVKALDSMRQSAQAWQADDHSPKIREIHAQIIERLEEIDFEYVRQAIPESLEHCHEGVHRVARIVRSMKEYVHTSGDEVAYANVNEAIETTLTLTKSEYKHVAEIAQEFGEIPAVRCSVNELNQILVNLIVNAIDAIGEVVAKTGAKGTIKICTWVDAKGVVFSIADTGCGIAKAHQSQVFDPFFTTKEVGKGTGQGLSLVWNLVVEKYLGEVWFESQEGHGTTFYVRLPRAVAAAA